MGVESLARCDLSRFHGFIHKHVWVAINGWLIEWGLEGEEGKGAVGVG